VATILDSEITTFPILQKVYWAALLRLFLEVFSSISILLASNYIGSFSLLTAVVLHVGQSGSHQDICSTWRHCTFYNWGKGVLLSGSIWVPGTAKYPIMHRHTPTTKSYESIVPYLRNYCRLGSQDAHPKLDMLHHKSAPSEQFQILMHAIQRKS
jgi:hypothetical protein